MKEQIKEVWVCHTSSIGFRKKKTYMISASSEKEAMDVIGKELPRNWGIDYCEIGILKS